VETVTFDRDRARAESIRQTATLQEALRLVQRGSLGDGRAVAEGASLSARINQAVLYKEG